jgi:hypothetical protein
VVCCEEATCKDGILNGAEKAVDCGSKACGLCDKAACTMDTECHSGHCPDGKCRPSTCFDKQKNGKETGEDCGGDCLLCDGGICTTAAECHSGHCPDGKCLAVTCFDNQKDGDETGVDCGGSCLLCDGGICTAYEQCMSGLCLESQCRPLSCFNSTLDVNEVGIDCGNACLACKDSPCTRDTLCASQTCSLLQKCDCSHCAKFIAGGVPPAPATICPLSLGVLAGLFQCVCNGNCASACNSCKKFNTELQSDACSKCITSPSGCATEAALCTADK